MEIDVKKKYKLNLKRRTFMILNNFLIEKRRKNIKKSLVKIVIYINLMNS